MLVAAEVDELGGYSVCFERLDAHDEKEACQDAMGDEVQNDKERARHGAQS